jgi:hypothetical protein
MGAMLRMVFFQNARDQHGTFGELTGACPQPPLVCVVLSWCVGRRYSQRHSRAAAGQIDLAVVQDVLDNHVEETRQYGSAALRAREHPGGDGLPITVSSAGH